MTNLIKLYSISELLEKHFFIPSYQRGYRWTDQHVEDLLDDIYAFASRKTGNEEFYCLQPIVVKKCDAGTLQHKISRDIESEKTGTVIDWYEVVDGQQRLTTIRLLFNYLIKKHLRGESLKDAYGKSEFIIDYETRKETRKFLDDITDSLKNSPEYTKKYIDFYYISGAYACISQWFESKPQPREARGSILKSLVHDMKNKKGNGIVQVVWYEISDDKNPIDTFIRINMGKIPLTNAELIKALFLQKRNFENDKTAELKQVEIANEWDRIEFTLQDNDFWWFINKTRSTVPARIEFLFDVMFKINENEAKKEGKLKKFQEQFGTDKYATFRFFNYKFSNDFTLEKVTDEWNSVKDYFLAFEEWFNEPVWFHYIGFLIYCGKSIVDIYNLYKKKNKDEFTRHLKLKIRKEILKKVECEKNERNGVFHYSIELPFENRNKQKIRELLLLLNIQFIVRQYETIKEESNDEIFVKFPFKMFKEGNWDIEHIDSYTENHIRDKDTQIKWLQTALEDLKGSISETLENEIRMSISFEHGADNFSDLHTKVIQEAGEYTNNNDLKKSIGNLTLLDAGTNRAYGNALFPTKRRMIIERDMEGKFIPICTKNVFLKYFDKRGTLRTKWTEDDIIEYQDFIGKILDDFLTFKNNSENKNGKI